MRDGQIAPTRGLTGKDPGLTGAQTKATSYDS